ncbi:hypothetical protein [Leptospira noguchii]|uniref:hypothetical protein n=1 Tax=Leptospira noguchii TaxID=28182 RepID=UPI0009E5A78A|nr:hypothetical protein [Leptospira noguchii]
MKFASCDDDPGNSVNAYLWGGVQGVVALSLLFAPIFLRRTHVILIELFAILKYFVILFRLWEFEFGSN